MSWACCIPAALLGQSCRWDSESCGACSPACLPAASQTAAHHPDAANPTPAYRTQQLAGYKDMFAKHMGQYNTLLAGISGAVFTAETVIYRHLILPVPL